MCKLVGWIRKRRARMSMERFWRALELRIAPLERVVEVFAASLSQPKRYEEELDRGFRYDAPNVRHFCLLKAARVVSALNASVYLALRRISPGNRRTAAHM